MLRKLEIRAGSDGPLGSYADLAYQVEVTFVFFFFYLSAGIGCYDNYPSVLLDSYTDEIDWFAQFASQMEKIIKKCAQLAAKKRYRYFAVEGYGNCYGAQNSPSGGGPKATRCNFGVGLDNYYYVYEVFL